jgi:hypothetical protein
VSDWKSIATAPEGLVVMTKIEDVCGTRNEQPLKRRGRLWFFPDDSMYVYYAPTHWKSIDARLLATTL